MKKFFLAVVVLSLCGLSMGQAPLGTGPEYTTKATFAAINNLSNCPAYNCLVPAGQPITFTQVTSAQDSGVAYGVNAAGNVYTLAAATFGNGNPTWNLFSAFGIVHQFLPGVGGLYALKSSSACTGTYRLYRWSGASWSDLSQCFAFISVSAVDNTLVGITATGGLSYTLNPQAPTPTWSAFNSPGSVFLNVAVYDSAVFYGTGTTHQIYKGNLVANTVALYATDTYSQLVVVGNLLFSLSLNPGVNGSNLNYLDISVGTKVNLKGGIYSAIGGGSPITFFAVAAGVPQHLLYVALSATTTISGTYNCGSVCPTGSYHHATAATAFAGGYSAGGSSTSSGLPASYLTASHMDVSGLCDLIYDDPYIESNCTPRAQGDVSCDMMGGVYASTLLPTLVDEEEATTRGLWNFRSSGCQTDKYGVTRCAYNVSNYCTAGTTPPDNDLTGYAVTDISSHVYWDVTNLCLRVLGGPWACLPHVGWAVAGDDPVPAALSCTHNP